MLDCLYDIDQRYFTTHIQEDIWNTAYNLVWGLPGNIADPDPILIEKWRLGAVFSYCRL